MTQIRASQIKASPIRVSPIRASQIRATQIKATRIRETKISSNHCELRGAIFCCWHWIQNFAPSTFHSRPFYSSFRWWDHFMTKRNTVSECQKGRVVKTTYQQFPLDGRPCQNARWVVLTPCENSPFMSECIVALYRNGTLSALDGYIVTLEFAHPVQHYHFDPERSTLDTYIRSQLNCGILTPNGTFTTRRCAHTERGTFSPWTVWFLPADALTVQQTETVCVKVDGMVFIYHRWMNHLWMSTNVSVLLMNEWQKWQKATKFNATNNSRLLRAKAGVDPVCILAPPRTFPNCTVHPGCQTWHKRRLGCPAPPPSDDVWSGYHAVAAWCASHEALQDWHPQEGQQDMLLRPCGELWGHLPLPGSCLFDAQLPRLRGCRGWACNLNFNVKLPWICSCLLSRKYWEWSRVSRIIH